MSEVRSHLDAPSQTSVTETDVTFEDLEKAAGQEEGETKVEIPVASPEKVAQKESGEEEEKEEEEEPEPEPTNPATRSHLGRKVKKLEERLEEVLTRLEGQEVKEKKAVVEDNDDEVVTTVADVKKILSTYTLNQQKEQEEYEKSYISTLLNFKTEPEFEQVYGVMLKNFNIKHTGNPAIDAELNFHKAATAFYKEQKVKKPVPVRGGGKIPTGIETPDQKDTTPKKVVKLDDTAVEFVKRSGITQEEIDKWLE